ncbi:nucleoside hydrolase [Consotaella aegiceratis]|uniref:nucleoside hydrolase n=1 Tax=Consotaella aegiceratis TaxID=3097961 RepID=UPI002F3FD761
MRLIIDTDTAGDDCFSIMLAARHPAVTLEALTICTGNIDFDQQVENALATLAVCDLPARVPVYAGCRRPLLRKPIHAPYVFGDDGMSGAHYPPAPQRPEPAHAVDALVDTVMASPGEIAIVAQAPLTNIAAAVTKEPGFGRAVKHLWIMGGTDNAMGNVTPAAEFNFYVDPEAAKIVFGAGFAITLVTWTLSLRDSYLSEADLAAIEALGTRRSAFFHQVNSQAVAFSRARYQDAGTVHPDTLTCACAIDESLILASEAAVVDIETRGDLTRGYSSVSSARLPDPDEADPDLAPAGTANARVVKKADLAGLRRMMMDALA